MRKLYSIFVVFLVPFIACAQYVVNADAVVSPSCEPNYQCFKLTPSELYKKGSVFHDTKIDLQQDFVLNARLNFGDLDGGADGIAFVMQQEGTGYIGNDGAGLGYHRFNGPPPMPVDNPGPVASFIVEFDTWENGDIFGQNVGDPQSDHLGFMSNSNAYHTSATTLQAPAAFSANIEDGEWHDVKFEWNATAQTMQVTFTTTNAPFVSQTFSYSGDIVNNIFGGDPMVYWGFTASTGSWNPNVHMVSLPVEAPPADCGQLRTQTPGGWGAPPNGNNPGMYLHNNFAAAFPTGLRVGSSPSYNIHFTSAQAITDYMPAGGQPAVLTQNYTNPATTALKNTLVSHIVALSLSVRFDEVDPDFGEAGIMLGDMIISSGAFANWTVSDFLAAAHSVLGGTSTAYTVQQVLSTASAINENYVDGNGDNNYLLCPGDTNGTGGGNGNGNGNSNGNSNGNAGNIAAPGNVQQATAAVNGLRVHPNPSAGRYNVKYNATIGQNVQVLILNSNGNVIESRNTVGGTNQLVQVDLSSFPAGLYYVKVMTDKGEQTQKLMLQK